MTSDLKQLVGQKIAERVTDGDILGVGTGTTVQAALRAIHERIETEKITVQVVPTSYQSSWACEKIGLTVLSPAYCGELSWGFDGADEIDPKLRLIKGRGGAMFHEKLVAKRCKEFIVIVSEDKCVEKLGQNFPIPVEVVPEAYWTVKRDLKQIGASEVSLREAEAVGRRGPYFTQSGNIVLDARFGVEREIKDDLENQINSISGVIENGLFSRMASEALIAGSDGVRTVTAHR